MVNKKAKLVSYTQAEHPKMTINVLTFRFLCVFVSIAFFKTGTKAEDSKAE